MRAILLLALLAGATRPAGAEPRLRSLGLPTRRQPDTLAARVAAVGHALAHRLDLALAAPVAPDRALGQRVAEALTASARGELDRAAPALDAALEDGARRPHRLPDPGGFLTAHIARVAIALARGEGGRADALLDRVLELDPGFALAADEDSPRVRTALDQARQRHRAAPTLKVAALGEACRDGADVLVVGRGLENGATEYLRFDHCQLVSRVAATAGEADLELAAALDPRPPAPARPALYQRPWFWVAVTGVAVLGGGVAIYAASRGPDSLTVDPHL